MYCPSCGYEADEGDEYCWHCGHEFDPRETSPSSETSKEDKRQPEGVDVSGGPLDDDVFAPLAHVLALPFWVFAPLAVYLLTENEFVKRNAANALNWQIAFSAYMIVSAFLVLFVVGILTALLVSFLNLVFCVVAAVKAADGETWEYPMTIDIVR